LLHFVKTIHYSNHCCIKVKNVTSFMHCCHGSICKEYLPSLAQKFLPSQLLTSVVRSETPVACGTLFCHWWTGTINAPSLNLLSMHLTTLWITSLHCLWNFVLVMAIQDTYWKSFTKSELNNNTKSQTRNTATHDLFSTTNSTWYRLYI
jgi:hypothetical protein